MLYFVNPDGRYAGCREKKPDEEVPEYATEIPVDITDEQEAFFVNGAWEIRTIQPENVVEVPKLEDVDERILALNGIVNAMLGFQEGYAFVLDNWMNGKPSDYVDAAYIMGFITEEERSKILATPRPIG